MSDGNLRVAVIGAGYWGPNLVRNLFEAPGAEAVAVADLSRDRLDAMAKRYPSVRTTRQYRELVDDPAIDAIFVATPVSTHRSIASEALRAGKHVLVEKPLAQDIAGAEALVALAAQRKRTLAVGHTFVYNPAVQKVREILESREVGDVYYVDSQRVNLGLHQFDINVLWDLGPHDISIVLYWLGEEPEWVSCTGACYVQPKIEDVVFLTMGFPSGALAHAHLSWLAPGKIRTMTVIGSKRMVVYDDVEVAEKVKVFDHGVERMDPHELRRSYRAGDIHAPHVAATEALQLEVRDFVDAVRAGRPPRSDGVAGLRVVRVLEAAMRSLREHGARVPYKLPELATQPEFATE